MGSKLLMFFLGCNRKLRAQVSFAGRRPGSSRSAARGANAEEAVMEISQALPELVIGAADVITLEQVQHPSIKRNFASLPDLSISLPSSSG